MLELAGKYYITSNDWWTLNSECFKNNGYGPSIRIKNVDGPPPNHISEKVEDFVERNGARIPRVWNGETWEFTSDFVGEWLGTVFPENYSFLTNQIFFGPTKVFVVYINEFEEEYMEVYENREDFLRVILGPLYGEVVENGRSV